MWYHICEVIWYDICEYMIRYMWYEVKYVTSVCDVVWYDTGGICASCDIFVKYVLWMFLLASYDESFHPWP